MFNLEPDWPPLLAPWFPAPRFKLQYVKQLTGAKKAGSLMWKLSRHLRFNEA